MIFKKKEWEKLLLQVTAFDTIGGFLFEVPNKEVTTLAGLLSIVANLLSFAVGLSALVAVVMIVYSGFLYITSSGEPENISKAGKALTAAIVGLIIVFLARTVIVFILKEFLL